MYLKIISIIIYTIFHVQTMYITVCSVKILPGSGGRKQSRFLCMSDLPTKLLKFLSIFLLQSHEKTTRNQKVGRHPTRKHENITDPNLTRNTRENRPNGKSPDGQSGRNRAAVAC